MIGDSVARFYLHIDDLDTDPDGTDLPDLAAAKREALLAARELLAEAIKLGREEVPLRFIIADAAGQVLEIVQTRDVLPAVLLNGNGRDRNN